VLHGGQRLIRESMSRGGESVSCLCWLALTLNNALKNLCCIAVSPGLGGKAAHHELPKGQLLALVDERGRVLDAHLVRVALVAERDQDPRVVRHLQWAWPGY